MHLRIGLSAAIGVQNIKKSMTSLILVADSSLQLTGKLFLQLLNKQCAFATRNKTHEVWFLGLGG